jgi:hypothetical protein
MVRSGCNELSSRELSQGYMQNILRVTTAAGGRKGSHAGEATLDLGLAGFDSASGRCWPHQV